MVTINDVAREAGVSKTTVSFVLSGSRPVAAATEQRIREAMDRLGYTVNHAARSLSTSKTMTIAVVTSNRQDAYSDIARGTYINGLSRAAAETGYDMLITNDPDGSATENACQSHKADGLVFLDVRQNDPRVPIAAESGIPTVSLGVPVNPMNLDVVDTDFTDMAASTMRTLHDAGHRRVSVITLSSRVIAEQLNDTVRFLREIERSGERLGMHATIRHCSTRPGIIDTDIARILDGRGEDTAFVIHNESAVLVFRRAVEHRGLRIPEDISVIAINEKQMSDALYLPYSAYENDVELVTQSAVNTLVDRIEHPELTPTRTLIKASYIDRDSVANI